MKAPLTVLFLLGLTGCTTLGSKEQCQHLNWFGRGYVDAQRARPLSFGQQYVASCRDHGVHLDISSWQRGYQKSLSQTCHADIARQYATHAAAYQGPCLQHPAFVQEYQTARASYQQQQADAKQAAELEALRQQIQALDGKHDRVSADKKQALEWGLYQRQAAQLESQTPMSVETTPLNPGLY